MSIVENLNSRRLFALFLLCAAPLLARAGEIPQWRSTITQQLLSNWQQISGRDGDGEVSFPGLPDDYQLPACNMALQLDPVRDLQPGRNGIEISCSSPYWKQHLAMQLHIYREVAVLARGVAADSALSEADFNYIRADAGELNKGFFTRTTDLNGQILRRTQRAGTILTPDMVEPPLVIQRGDEVRILVERPGIRIEMKGTALDAARSGERLRVRNDQSEKVITATAVRAGLVQVR